jgi:predicted AlkP superfamily phosphohydrolase/phosphomutase
MPRTGGYDRLAASRALVIGLDCAPPELVFERWREELPTIRSLTEAGRYGVLRSCDPPITVPAWACMTSSRSPGTLGIYGFPKTSSTTRAAAFPSFSEQ